LPIRNMIWRLLQLDDLLVRECRSVVDHLHAVRRVTDGPGTFGRLGDLSAIDICLDSVVANGTFEES
jgi:hypothetical protein